MFDEQKRTLSSLMDNETIELSSIDELIDDEAVQQCWHRYHIARDAMHGKLHESTLSIDIMSNVAQAIALDDIYEQPAVIAKTQSLPSVSLFWVKVKEIGAKFGQVGLAACVTLGVIAGVQYQQGQSESSDMSVLNPLPIGVSVSPVGGPLNDTKDEKVSLDQAQYNKLKLLLQDYELQKRLNTQ